MKDAFYFSHDAGARNDPKILAMRSVYGSEGYGWFWMIVEMMREQSDYRLMHSKYIGNALAMQLQCDKNAALKFVDDCINEFHLFESDGESFWSPSLLKRMEKRDEKSSQARRAALARWGKSEKDTEQCGDDAGAHADAMQTHSDRNAIKERKGKERKDDISSESKSDSIPYEEIKNLFNDLTPSLHRVISLSDKRRSAIRARWKEHPDIETFKTLFSKAESSDFLSGRNGKWTSCTFDWLLNPNNMLKVLEGAYDNKVTLNGAVSLENQRRKRVHT